MTLYALESLLINIMVLIENKEQLELSCSINLQLNLNVATVTRQPELGTS